MVNLQKTSFLSTKSANTHIDIFGMNWILVFIITTYFSQVSDAAVNSLVEPYKPGWGSRSVTSAAPPATQARAQPSSGMTARSSTFAGKVVLWLWNLLSCYFVSSNFALPGQNVTKPSRGRRTQGRRSGPRHLGSRQARSWLLTLALSLRRKGKTKLCYYCSIAFEKYLFV